MEQPSPIFLSIICLIFGTLAISTNTIMIYVFLREKRFLRPMHSYLFSDGVTNILTGIVLIIIAVLLMFRSMNSCMTQWLLEEMLILIIVTGFLSILFIATERYRTLVLLRIPITHNRRLLLIIFIWFIALAVLSIRVIHVKTHSLSSLTNQTEICYANDNHIFTNACYTRPEFDSIFITVLLLGFYLFPAIISVYFYSQIIKRLWKRRRLGSNNYQEKKRKAIKAMVYMLSACAMCWLPFCVYRLTVAWMKTNEMCYSHCLITLYILGCTESAVSVLVYISHSQDFRHAFKLVFKCCSASKSPAVSPCQPSFIKIRPLES
uniref:G-protein coupled receptors family 1 profile domain-containing protein n=1 Tax=Strigamia maritima TaxID=126957 RepID=T1J288_STRMM